MTENSSQEVSFSIGVTLVNGSLAIIGPVVMVVIKLHRDLEIQSVGKEKAEKGWNTI